MRPLPVVAAVLAAAATLALTGCTGSLVAHERRGTVESTKALELAWSSPATHPDWLPADSTDIRYAAATSGGADAAPAAVRATTATALTDCAEAGSARPASIAASWAPRSTGDVRRCGNWYVARVADGYYGWTPAR